MNTPPDCHVMSLPLYGFLAVEGARAVEFLQAQLSCDLREATPERVLSGAWCSIKGRVLANMLLRPDQPGRVLLRLRADLAADTAAALGRYATLSRVQILPWPTLACVGVAGREARARITALLGAAPGERLATRQAADGTTILQRDTAGRLFELWTGADTAAGLVAALAAGAAPATVQDWTHALVEAGIAEIQQGTRDQFLPQMLGYDTDGTVSFRKGCYPGQEVVARAHYKGAVKRQLARLRAEDGACPEPGSELRAGERAAGSVVEAAADRAGRLAVLAVLGPEALAAGSVRTSRGVVLHPAPADPVL